MHPRPLSLEFHQMNSSDITVSDNSSVISSVFFILTLKKQNIEMLVMLVGGYPTKKVF